MIRTRSGRWIEKLYEHWPRTSWFARPTRKLHYNSSPRTSLEAALAVLLGVVGTLSLVIDPISWLAGGNTLSEVFTEANLLFFLIAPIRTVHLAAVIAALVLMFLPAANTYFRGSRSVTRQALG